MADIVANIAKGRIIELYNRVENADPANASFYLIPIDSGAGALTDDEFADSDDFAAVITAGATERTTGGWNRKTINAAALAALPAPDDTNNRYDVDMPDQTWTAVTAGAVTDLVLCYASVASPTNAQLMPLIMFDFAITPDGSDVVAQVNTAGFFRAS